MAHVAFVRAAWLVRLTGAAAAACALGAVASALTGRTAQARALIGLAVPLGGVALLAAALLFLYARRLRRQQDSQ